MDTSSIHRKTVINLCYYRIQDYFRGPIPSRCLALDHSSGSGSSEGEKGLIFLRLLRRTWGRKHLSNRREREMRKEGEGWIAPERLTAAALDCSLLLLRHRRGRLPPSWILSSTFPFHPLYPVPRPRNERRILSASCSCQVFTFQYANPSPARISKHHLGSELRLVFL